MLYTKIQPQSFLSSGEDDFKSFLPYIYTAKHIFQWREIIRTICQFNWIIVFRGDIQTMNSQHFPI